MTYGAGGVLALVIVLFILMVVLGARHDLFEKLLLVVGVVAAVVLVLAMLGIGLPALDVD